MTTFGIDCSHWDWTRGTVDLGAMRRDGIEFATHKVAEGHQFYVDDRFGEFIRRARAAGFQCYGGYFVNHPGDQVAQVDWFVQVLTQQVPDWRTDPRFRLIQMDAEKFNYMDRAPNPAECRAWMAAAQQRTGRRPLAYAPRWLYGNTLAGELDDWPLWQSAYGANPTAGYRAAYPGDGSDRWAAYSGQVPKVLQYGSSTNIGNQKTCDANGFRGTVAELIALTVPIGGQVPRLENAMTGDDDMPTVAELLAADVVRTPGITYRLDDTLWEARQNALAANTRAIRLEATLASLVAMVGALATGTGHTPLELEEIAHRGAAKALAEAAAIEANALKTAPTTGQ